MPKRKFAKIVPEHHVVRRCGHQVIERDSVSNEVKGLFPAAMRLRENINETYLSTSWLEYCEGTRAERLKAVVAIHRAKAKSRLSPNSGIAVINAGRIVELGAAQ